MNFSECQLNSEVNFNSGVYKLPLTSLQCDLYSTVHILTSSHFLRKVCTRPARVQSECKVSARHALLLSECARCAPMHAADGPESSLTSSCLLKGAVHEIFAGCACRVSTPLITLFALRSCPVCTIAPGVALQNNLADETQSL